MQQTQGNPRQTEKIQQRLRPGVPQRAEHRGENAEARGGAQQHRSDGVQPQPPLPDAQHEKEKEKPGGKAVQRIRKPGKPRQTQAERTEQVIEQGKHQTEGERNQQGSCLRRIIDVHRSQPNRRRKKPRSAGALS